MKVFPIPILKVIQTRVGWDWTCKTIFFVRLNKNRWYLAKYQVQECLQVNLKYKPKYEHENV